MPQPAYAKPGPYITQLPAADEATFQSWVKQNHVPFDPSPTSDYDMRGYYKDNVLSGDGVKTKVSAFDGLPHFPDTYKTPYHKTFSNESRYATADAPHWEGDVLKDKRGNIVADETPKTKAPKAQSDPWEQAAAQYKASGAPTGGAPNEDWKVWQQGSDPQQTINTPGQMAKSSLKLIGKAGSDVLQGIGESALKTSYGVGKMILPDWLIGAHPESDAAAEKLTTPDNKLQGAAKFGADAGQFLIPGEGEEMAVSKLASLAPKAAPLARIGVGAVSSGLVNKAQGGGFTQGAVTGGATGVLGEGFRAVAPAMVESALGIGGNARRFGRQPGRAILDETSGIRPSTIAQQGNQRISELTKALHTTIDDAGRRPQAPIRGLLPAPQYDVPLASTRTIAPKSSPMAFRAESDIAPIQMSDHINQDIELPQYLSGSEHPELSGRVSQSKGVLRTRDPNIARQVGAGTTPAAEEIPYNGISLNPSREVLTRQMQEYASRNAAPSIERIQPLRRVLSTTLEPRGGFPEGVVPRRTPGTPIPELVSPEEALGLRRTVGDYQGEHPWTGPKKADPLDRGIRNAYGTLTRGIHEQVPGAIPLDDRISSLIPGVSRAEEVSLNAPTTQRVMGRLGAHTGAATMGTMAATLGASHGGLPGAIAGGIAGLVGPEIASAPAAKMAMARVLNSAHTGRIMRSMLTPGTREVLDWIKSQNAGTGGQGQ